MRQKSKAKGKRILGVVLALVFLISCIMTPDVHAQAESMIIENRRYSGSDSDTSGRGDGNGKSDIFQRSFYLSVSNSGNQCKCRHGFYDSGKLRFRKQTCKRNC